MNLDYTDYVTDNPDNNGYPDFTAYVTGNPDTYESGLHTLYN